MSTFREMTEYVNWIIKNPSAYSIDIDARIAFTKEYLALQTRVEELEKSISKAVEEINKEWIDGKADGETYDHDDGYQSGIAYALDILRKHGLIGCNK